MKNKFLLTATLVILLGGGIFFWQGTGNTATDDAMMKDVKTTDEKMMATSSDSMMKEDAPGMGENMEGSAMKKGSYEPYSPEKIALASSGKVVLFFHAEWCPICRGLESSINARISEIPEGVHLLKVDYDSSTELKKKYGVTYQHTFVQVRADGSLVQKWGDSFTFSDVIGHLQ